MKRRTFFNWAGIGLLASYFPLALAACSQGSGDPIETTTNEDLVSVGTIAELESAGYILNEESKVVVVRDGEDKIIALNPTCTHRGCIVEWDSDSNILVCPCHNAKYAPSGKVIAKPAVEPLSTYEVQQENSEILVKLT